ncbi:MAG: putative peptidoglycan glycosyltransferase FtsW [Opitutaceae bacterium]|jgi:cell division protein FtsW
MSQDALAPDPVRGRFVFNPAAIIVVCAIGLAALGITILFSATVSFKQGPYSYLNKQIFGLVGAIFLAFVVSRLNLENARRHVWVVGGLSVFALILVLIPHLGIEVKGSKRWLGYGPVRFQVSEFGKIAMVFCLAHYLAINQTRIGDLKRGYFFPLMLIGLFSGLIILEPDFGTSALTLVVGLVLLFLAGAKWRYILPTVAMAAVGFTVMVIHNQNRLERFTAYLDVEGNKGSRTYQLYQSLCAFAFGGLDGVGLGQGRQQQHFLPEAHTDFIFAVIGEELGMWFTLGVVAIFTIMFMAGVVHLRRAPNLFQFLLVTGSILLISLQAIINLGVVTGLLPTKGMSLPFISAGLSNLLLMGVLVGIIVNTQRAWTRPGLDSGRRTMQELTS